MAGHMTQDATTAIATQAYEHAIRLGHPCLGGEHGVTPGRVEAQARHATQPAGVEEFALGILAISEGLVPPILSALGVSGPALSAAIRDRCHPAS